MAAPEPPELEARRREAAALLAALRGPKGLSLEDLERLRDLTRALQEAGPGPGRAAAAGAAPAVVLWARAGAAAAKPRPETRQGPDAKAASALPPRAATSPAWPGSAPLPAILLARPGLATPPRAGSLPPPRRSLGTAEASAEDDAAAARQALPPPCLRPLLPRFAPVHVAVPRMLLAPRAAPGGTLRPRLAARPRAGRAGPGARPGWGLLLPTVRGCGLSVASAQAVDITQLLGEDALVLPADCEDAREAPGGDTTPEGEPAATPGEALGCDAVVGAGPAAAEEGPAA